MVYCSTWEDLIKESKTKTLNILSQDIAPVAKEIVERHIQSDIYNAYTPQPHAWVNGDTYKRRGSLLKNMTVDINQTTFEIFITNNAMPDSPIVQGSVFQPTGQGSFLRMLSSGNTGIWKRGFPRPAIENAVLDFKNGNELKSAIQKGINREF